MAHGSCLFFPRNGRRILPKTCSRASGKHCHVRNPECDLLKNVLLKERTHTRVISVSSDEDEGYGGQKGSLKSLLAFESVKACFCFMFVKSKCQSIREVR